MKAIFKGTCAVLALAVILTSNAFAATQSTTISVSASVQSALGFDVAMTKVNPATNAETTVTSMAFGNLAKNGFGGLDAANFFKVYMTANTQSLPYTIAQNGTTVTNGTTTLPNAALTVDPQFLTAGSPGALGTKGTWVGARTLYTSNAAGASPTVIGYYGLVGDPSKGAGNYVPETQAAGSYTGSIVFTLTTT